VVKQLLMQPVY